MSRLFKSAYEPKNLLKTNVAASGILLLLGDIIQQNIELYRGVHEKGEERMATKTSACNDDIPLDPPTFAHFVTSCLPDQIFQSSNIGAPGEW